MDLSGRPIDQKADIAKPSWYPLHDKNHQSRWYPSARMIARAVGNNTQGVTPTKLTLLKPKQILSNNIKNIYELAHQQDQHTLISKPWQK